MLFTFYDVETSGLESGCDVLSFSYMLADESLNVKRAETLYFWKEGVTKWTEDSYRIHGLSKEFLRQFEKDYDRNLRKMYIAMSYADLVGYNSGYFDAEGIVHGFDYTRCKSFLLRNGMPELTVLGMYDVMRIYKAAYHPQQSKLQSIFDASGLPRALADAFTQAYFGGSGKAHESAYDVVCTALLFQKLFNEGQVLETPSVIMNLDEDIEERGLNEYQLFFQADNSLAVRNTYEDTVMCLSEFQKRYPELFSKMMLNPNAYM